MKQFSVYKECLIGRAGQGSLRIRLSEWILERAEIPPASELDELVVYSKSLELKESKYEASWMEDTIRSICAFNLEKG